MFQNWVQFRIVDKYKHTFKDFKSLCSWLQRSTSTLFKLFWKGFVTFGYGVCNNSSVNSISKHNCIYTAAITAAFYVNLSTTSLIEKLSVWRIAEPWSKRRVANNWVSIGGGEWWGASETIVHLFRLASIRFLRIRSKNISWTFIQYTENGIWRVEKLAVKEN